MQERLIQAITENDYDAVKELLSKGVDPNKVNSKWQVPLFLATRLDNPEIAELLISEGALIETYGSSAVFFSGSLNTLKMLAKYCDLTFRDPEGNTACHYFVCSEAPHEMISFVAQRVGAISIKNNEGYTPLDDAAFEGMSEAIIACLDARQNDEEDLWDSTLDNEDKWMTYNILSAIYKHRRHDLLPATKITNHLIEHYANNTW